MSPALLLVIVVVVALVVAGLVAHFAPTSETEYQPPADDSGFHFPDGPNA